MWTSWTPQFKNQSAAACILWKLSKSFYNLAWLPFSHKSASEDWHWFWEMRPGSHLAFQFILKVFDGIEVRVFFIRNKLGIGMEMRNQGLWIMVSHHPTGYRKCVWTKIFPGTLSEWIGFLFIWLCITMTSQMSAWANYHCLAPRWKTSELKSETNNWLGRHPVLSLTLHCDTTNPRWKSWEG